MDKVSQTPGRSTNPFMGFFSDLSERSRQYRAYRTTLAELDSLSDRELSDLGISRMSVRSIARQSVFGG